MNFLLYFVCIGIISFLICELKNKNFVFKEKNPMPRNINIRYVQDTEFAILVVKKSSKWIFNKPKDKKYLRSEFITNVCSFKKRKIKSYDTKKYKVNEWNYLNSYKQKNDIILAFFMFVGIILDSLFRKW